MNSESHDDKETPQGSEDNASQIRLGKEGRNDLHHNGGNRVFGSSVQYPWGESERNGGDDGQGGNFPRGGEIVGGTLSQLVQDCKDQIAGNEKIINSLQETNDLLIQRVVYYQQILSQIQE
jgi:hypothetical protein